VLFPRDVDDGVVGAHRVEGLISEWQRHEIGTNPERGRNVTSCEAELHLGKVDADDMGTSSEPLGDGDTGSATSIEDTRPRRQAAEEIVQQRDIRRIGPTGFEIRSRDAIVRVPDLRSRIHDWRVSLSGEQRVR